MERAITAVRDNVMGTLKASKTYNVPRSTLQRLAKKPEAPRKAAQTLLGRKPVLGEELETELVEYILAMESKFYGLTRRDVRQMAYTLATRNNIDNPFKREIAGRSWLDSFLHRHRNTLSTRRPTGTSFARALGFNKENIKEFFDNLEREYEKHNFPAHRIYNVDETGLSIVQSKVPEVIGRKGKRQIAALTSAERGSLVTLIVCMSAGGQYVPPMLIFPRKNRNDQLMRGAPPGSIYAVHPSGWIQHNLFTQWFQHFIQFVKPSENDPVLLILDGHYSHTRNMDVIELARENHVSIISLPPHSTHKLQPLDKTFMGSFKAYYSEEIRKWIREHQRAVTPFDLAELLANALLKSETSEIAKKGFEVTGIYKLDRHIFSDADFIAEEIDAEKRCNNTTIIDAISEATTVDEPQPGCSKSGTTSSSLNSPNLCKPQDFISPFQISPVPGIRRKTSNRGRKASKSQIITSSPYKNELEISQAKPEANRGKRKLCQIRMNSQQVKEKKAKGKKKQRIIESSGSEAESEFLAADEDSDMEEVGSVPSQDTDVTCMFCDSPFSQDSRGELWVRCLMCQLWAHEECAGTETDAYVCDFCK